MMGHFLEEVALFYFDKSIIPSALFGKDNRLVPFSIGVIK